tara:strand:- start:14 stop:544 length:531 start_codon:yes stop_codon:yes gene_type:complete
MPFKKIGRALKKTVTAPVKVAKIAGNAVIDAGTKTVKATTAVVGDVYSGTKKTIGAVGRGTSKIGSGLVEGTAGILSDPVSLVGVATGNPALILGGQAVKRLGGGTFVDPLTGQVAAFDPTGQPFVIQQPMVPGNVPFQAGTGGQSGRQGTNLNNILLIGGLGIAGILLFSNLRRN